MSAIHEKSYKGILIDQAELSAASTEQLPENVINQIAQNAGFKIPAEQIEQEAQSLMQGYLARLRYERLYYRQGAFHMIATESNNDDMLELFRQQAANELMEEKILRAIILAENIQVTAEELEEEGRQISKRQGLTLADVKDFFGKDLSFLKSDMQKKKARELIYTFAESK